MIRDALDSDFPALLALNEESVAVLSPLDRPALASLHAQAARHRVAEIGGEVAAFLLVLREGADYASPNYRWFAANYDRFLYVDRVVVSLAHQGRGLGRRLYDDLFDWARREGFERIACEFDIEPPNEASRRFHAGYGFREVGSQRVSEGKKRVSLQIAAL